MDGVWERRESSLTEPQWDNEGRPDKDAWGGVRQGGVFTTEFKMTFLSY